MPPEEFLDIEFLPAHFPAHAYRYEHYMSAFGLSKANAKRAVQRVKEEKTWLSKSHQVNETRFVAAGLGPGIWLSIKRLDKEPIARRDVLAGILRKRLPGYCGFELLPAPLRLVDTANQYHLWCFEQHLLPELCSLELQGTAPTAWASPWTGPLHPVVVYQGGLGDWRELYQAKEQLYPGQEAALYFGPQAGVGADTCVLVLPRIGESVSLFPFGFRDRLVMGDEALLGTGARQRSLDKGYEMPKSDTNI